MQKIDLKSIKVSSVKSVFRAMVSAEKATRAELAQATSLSLMTVGKIADSFTRLGITFEKKEASGAVGRRASVLRIADLYYGILLDFTADDYVCEIANTAAGTIDRFSYAHNPEFYEEENLLLFLKNLRLYLNSRYDPEKCIGTGIILPAGEEKSRLAIALATEERELKEAICTQITNALKEYAPFPIACTLMEAAATYITDDHAELTEKIALYCRITDTVESALVVSGKILAGKRGPIGSIRDPEESGSEPLRADLLAQAIRQAEVTLDPHVILIEAAPSRQRLLLSLQKELSGTCNGAEVSYVSGSLHNPRAGLLYRLRDHWIDSIISPEI